MIINTYPIYRQGEYTNPLKGKFTPNLTAYLHEDGIRPAFIVVPGGGYRMVAIAEGEIVAKKFYKKVITFLS